MSREELIAKAKALLAKNPHWGEKRLKKALPALTHRLARDLVKETFPTRAKGSYKRTADVLPTSKKEKPKKVEKTAIEVVERKKSADDLLGLLQKDRKGVRVETLETYETGALDQLERRGYLIEYRAGTFYLDTNPERHINTESFDGVFDPTRKVHRFMFMGDTHFGGDQAQPAFVIAMLQEAARRGCSAVFHGGDVVDGHTKMHAGFEYELKLTRSDDQVDFAAWVMGHSTVPIFGIGGNHDNSFFKSGGLNVCRQIAERCSPYHYIGPIAGWITGPNDDPNFLRLFHPGDGCSYALSYKDQKMAEVLVLENDKIPTGFHASSHYHKYNNMRGPNGARYFLVPASCGRTNFMKAKRLINMAGVIFVEFTLDAQGRVDRCIFEDVPLWPNQWTKCDYSNIDQIRKEVNRLIVPSSAW